MSDLISRQAAIDAINALHEKPNAWLDSAVDAVMTLPSVGPVKNEMVTDFVDTAEKAAKVKIMSKKDAQITLDAWRTYNRILEADHE